MKHTVDLEVSLPSVMRCADAGVNRLGRQIRAPKGKNPGSRGYHMEGRVVGDGGLPLEDAVVQVLIRTEQWWPQNEKEPWPVDRTGRWGGWVWLDKGTRSVVLRLELRGADGELLTRRDLSCSVRLPLLHRLP